MPAYTSISELSRTELRDTARDLHSQLHTRPVVELLHTRHLFGVLTRHAGDVDQSLRSLRATKKEAREGALGALVVTNIKGRAIGMATAMPDVPLNQQRETKIGSRTRTLPPYMARLVGAALPVETSGPKISAWIAPENGPRWDAAILAQAYTHILAYEAETGLYHSSQDENSGLTTREVAWTVESRNSPTWVHAAIKRAGFAAAGIARYDDHESRRMVPPTSTLYEIPVKP